MRRPWRGASCPSPGDRARGPLSALRRRAARTTPDAVGGERHVLRGPGECLPQPDLVVDPDTRVAALHPVHPDHAAVRVFGISEANPGGGGLRALDEDDVSFLQFEDLHDLGVDAYDPAARVRGFRLGAPEEFLTAGGHLQRASFPAAAVAAFA